MDIIKLANSPLKFRLFLLSKLPSAFFSGLRVVQATDEVCKISVPFKWFTKNPFKSTYFACLAMAAEMSTGLLALNAISKSNKKLSMLVVNLEAEYLKKATDKTIFTCENGHELIQAVSDAVRLNIPTQLQAKTVGKNKQNEVVAIFHITWSFKLKAN